MRNSLTRYLRYWIIRLVYEQREQTERLIQALRDEQVARSDGAQRIGTVEHRRGVDQCPSIDLQHLRPSIWYFPASVIVASFVRK